MRKRRGEIVAAVKSSATDLCLFQPSVFSSGRDGFERPPAPSLSLSSIERQSLSKAGAEVCSRSSRASLSRYGLFGLRTAQRIAFVATLRATSPSAGTCVARFF